MKEGNIVQNKKFEEAQDEIDRCYDQIARQANQNNALRVQLDGYVQ